MSGTISAVTRLKAIHTTSSPARRTQRQRREATIAKLLDATVAALIDVGYTRASIKEICLRAGVSDGGLFRHFQSRLDLIIAAADHIAERELENIRRQVEKADLGDEPLAVLVPIVRDAVRAPTSRVWRELLAAARTHSELRHRLEPVTRRFMHALRELFAELPGFKKLPRQRFELWLPLLVHLFDGEAIFSVVLPNPEAEDRLLAFVTTLMIASANSKTLPS